MRVFAQELKAMARPPAKPESEFDPTMGQRLPLRILVAEDNVINQQVSLSLLGRLGYRADVAANGLEVLSSLRRQPYDVVLMDVQMPELDGLEATRRVRQLPPVKLAAQAQPRIIAMTANAMREACDLCLEAGMDDYVSKPVKVQELMRALRRCHPHRPVAARHAQGELDAKSVGADSPDKPAPGTTAPEVLDPRALDRLRRTLGRQAENMLPGLLEGFLRDAERLLADARRALEQELADDLLRAAHTLKSTSATVGAMQLSSVARRLEHQARLGTLEAADKQIAKAQSELDRVRIALAAIDEAT
jgi:CheY-like chemotaxis protein/HPt (histidine-containing phosphotransfer) domain-containing protein